MSVKVDATVPVVAERPIYFNADPGVGSVVDGGHDVVGVSTLATTYLFAEGTVRAGFVEYLTLQNPGGAAGTATLTYQGATDSGIGLAIPAQTVALPALSRVTVRVNDHLAATGVPLPANVSVKVTANIPIAAERPLYFKADPGLGTAVDGGHDTVGLPG